MKDPIKIENLTIEEDGPLFLIAGPCVIENEETTLKVAAFLKETSQIMDIPVIFKTSYDKANRTSLDSYRGPGLDRGLEIIQKIKEETELPVLSDIHEADEIEKAADVLDVIQIPAFMCRQTNLLLRAAETGLPINIKKGQFLSPGEMGPAIQKITSTGNQRILVTERGTSCDTHARPGKRETARTRGRDRPLGAGRWGQTPKLHPLRQGPLRHAPRHNRAPPESADL